MGVKKHEVVSAGSRHWFKTSETMLSSSLPFCVGKTTYLCFITTAPAYRLSTFQQMVIEGQFFGEVGIN